MAEYIEREAAIAAAFSATSLGNSAFRDVSDTVNRLRLIPAADVAPRCPHYIRNVHDRGDDSLCVKWGCEIKEVAPVRHGRWIWQDAAVIGNPYGSYKCECGCIMPHKTDYCPNCGARLDLEEDDGV